MGLITNTISAEPVEHAHDDLAVVNAARVSFDATSASLTEKDVKLIRYLAKNRHWTPFGHVWRYIPTVSTVDFLKIFGVPDFSSFLSLVTAGFGRGVVVANKGVYVSLAHAMRIPSLRLAFSDTCPYSCAAFDEADGRRETVVDWRLEVGEAEPSNAHCTVQLTMPYFVARQWMRSNGGIVYNEVSRRYVDDYPEVFIPTALRSRPIGSIKQGSGAPLPPGEERAFAFDHYLSGLQAAVDSYNKMLEYNVAPEQARSVLPEATFTSMWMTALPHDFLRVLALRLHPHAQEETKKLAEELHIALQRHDAWSNCISEETWNNAFFAYGPRPQKEVKDENGESGISG